jgi:hypothetical protein
LKDATGADVASGTADNSPEAGDFASTRRPERVSFLQEELGQLASLRRRCQTSGTRSLLPFLAVGVDLGDPKIWQDGFTVIESLLEMISA